MHQRDPKSTITLDHTMQIKVLETFKSVPKDAKRYDKIQELRRFGTYEVAESTDERDMAATFLDSVKGSTSEIETTDESESEYHDQTEIT